MPFFTAPGDISLHYEDTGHADPEAAGLPPLLCLAGLTRNVKDFDHIPALIPDHRVIRLSTRGRGLSDPAPNPEAEYNPVVEAGDALALLDHLGLERTAILGTSRGGILGMAIQQIRPGITTGLILNDIGALVETAGLRRIAGYAGKPLQAQSFEEAAEGLAASHAADFPGVPLSRWLVHAHAIHKAGADGRPTLGYDPALARVALNGVEDLPPQLDLSPLHDHCRGVPTLVIQGRNSDILSDRTVAAMIAEREECRAVQLADRGHAPFLDEPEAVTAIRAFLARPSAQE